MSEFSERPPIDLGKYLVDPDAIGEGNLSSVYKAIDKKSEKIVAIKASKEPLFDRYILNEVDILTPLSHPNIMATYGLVDFLGRTASVLEFHKGTTLQRKIDLQGSIKPAVFAPILEQLAAGIDYLADHGVVHMDLKPENILLSEKLDGRPIISDFGHSRKLDLQYDLSITGSPAYMSPEVKAFQEVDHRSDIYSLGALSFEALTASIPAGENFTPVMQTTKVGHVEYEIGLLFQLFDRDLARSLEPVFNKVFQIKKDSRYQSAGEFYRDFGKAVNR